MIIDFHKHFHKSYNKLDKKMQFKVDETIFKFRKNPYDSSLKNHALKGSMQGKRSFSVTGDIRIIFEEKQNYILVIMLDVGTHNQVY